MIIRKNHRLILISLILVYCLKHICICVTTDKRDLAGLQPEKFIIFGPGLDSSLALPVRYIFVQLVDRHGDNITYFHPDSHELLLSAHFRFLTDDSSNNNKDNMHRNNVPRIQHDVLYIQFGLFVIRFRLFSSILHDSIVITLTWLPHGALIGRQSIILRTPIYSELCYCPQMTLRKWLDVKLNCSQLSLSSSSSSSSSSSAFSQIDADFSHFVNIDPEENARLFEKRYSPFTSVAVCRYKVIDNRIYRRCFGEHVGFRMFVDSVLVSLASKVKLPDLDFLFNLGDWPLSFKDDAGNQQRRSNGSSAKKLAMVSWCGSNETLDIVVPTYETMEWVLGMMTQVTTDVFTMLQDCANPDWLERIPRAFWRGRDSSEERLRLVRLSLARPDLLDARLTHMFFFPNESLGWRAASVPFADQYRRHRFAVHLDGTVAAYRLPLALAGGALLLRQQSSYYEYFYGSLLPWRHYWPVDRNLDNLLLLLERAVHNDSDVPLIRESVRRAVRFVHDNLMPHNILYYYGRVLQRLSDATLLPTTKVPTTDFELVFDGSRDIYPDTVGVRELYKHCCLSVADSRSSQSQSQHRQRQDL